MSTDLIVSPGVNPVDLAITAWLATKAKRSGSAKTQTAYAAGLAGFRARVRGQRLDLDGTTIAVDRPELPASEARTALALIAQLWADQGQPAPTTFNQRLAILSSFYTYANTQGLIALDNPILRIERRRVDAYAGAQPLSYAVIQERLAALDTTSLVGARNRALLMVGLQCGRRRSELAGLRWGDVRISGGAVTLTWRHTKGGKTLYDTLPRGVANVLLEWLSLFYGAQLRMLPSDAPIWVSLSANDSWGQPLDTQSLGDICQRHLGTSKVHTLRHTFAKAMEDAGAKVSEIQKRLGHSSLATTGIYLQKLGSATNAHADDLATLFGFTAPTDDYDTG
jgi:integrase